MEVRLFPHNVLLSVPAADSPFLLFFHEALLTVRKQAVTTFVLTCVSKLDDSSTLAFGCSNNDSDAVNPDFPELGKHRW